MVATPKTNPVTQASSWMKGFYFLIQMISLCSYLPPQVQVRISCFIFSFCCLLDYLSVCLSVRLIDVIYLYCSVLHHWLSNTFCFCSWMINIEILLTYMFTQIHHLSLHFPVFQDKGIRFQFVISSFIFLFSFEDIFFFNRNVSKFVFLKKSFFQI